MKVNIMVEFDVESEEDGFDEKEAKAAASVAAWDYLCLTRNGQDVADDAEVHVDGVGKFTVKVAD